MTAVKPFATRSRFKGGKRPLSHIISDGLIVAVMWFVIVLTLYPFIYVLSMSISDPQYVVEDVIWLFPKGFSLESYARVFDNPDIWTAYGNTLFYAGVGTLLNILFTVLAAYPLSRRTFSLRTPIIILVTITMFFGGGLIPNFLLIKELGLYNTRWAILLPGLTSAFYIIITRTFFQSIPESLQESARIDGANDIGILMRIILPLSQPILAVLALFYAVGHWNSYFTAMIYLPDVKLQPVSLYLVKVLVQDQQSMMEGMMNQYDRALISVQLKYSMIIVTILPILFIYPFLQKYFVKGVMIGSLKE
ncbi:carbohydrate ABC transporter permease [Paenibacillus eucommiae]|uniref:Aldouronate transport system permease protein n=1 Tax=Paenibacillus eucommiae TaxID=1355755 RepID=A0ABS4IW62_9BACL|nr:carbohydrate ABC transporter permease [Paenibacillus eucommiae]MBP1990749.1 putative aldouronate transport system permease protein [Paenibacillus eucommiae]